MLAASILRRVLVLIGASALALPACAVEVAAPEGDGPGDPELAPSDQALLGGTITTRPGIVSLQIEVSPTTVGNCTGVLLNRFGLLTAGHCFRNIPIEGGQTRTVNISAVYKRPDATSVCLTGGPITRQSTGRLVCTTKAPYEVSVAPGHVQSREDAAHDLAVLKSHDIFTAVSPSDYALIDVGPVPSGQLEYYGYSFNSTNRTGAGALRRGWGILDEVHSTHIDVEEDGARACVGDSGGPLSRPWSTTSPDQVVFGVLSIADVAENGDVCAEDGAIQTFTYIKPKMDFVTSKLGVNCRQFNHPRTGRATRRCFEYPVAFWARANGKYVQASDAGNGPLIANADEVGPWERFEYYANPDGTTSFIALVNHKLVTAEDGGNLPLIANRTQIGDWEKFYRHNINLDGWVGEALRSRANARFVAAEDGGDSPLIARTWPDPDVWEQFFFETVP